MSRSGLGCGTHLLIAFGLFVGAIGIIAYQNSETVSMMWENVTAMNEGMGLTEELRYPEHLIDYIEAHPETVSLVAYDTGARDDGISFGADTERPMVNLSNIVVLTAYAEAVAAGDMEGETRIAISEVTRRALPGVNEQPHQRTINHWAEEGAIDADSTVTLNDLMYAVARFNDDPSLDWLMGQLGYEALAAQTEAMGLPPEAVPLPQSGLYLQWAEVAPTLRTDEESASDKVSPNAVYARAERYAADSSYANSIRETFRTRGTNLTLRDQRRMAQETLPQGTAHTMGEVLTRMASASPPDPQAEAFAALDRSTGIDTLTVGVQRIASKGGAMPGVISFAGVAHYADDRPPRVVVLFMEEVPLAVFYHLLQSGIDQGLALQLLGDDAFFEDTRTRLHN